MAIKVLIIGLGSIGRRHLAAVHHVCGNAELLVLRRSGGLDGVAVPGVRVIHDMAEALALGPDIAIVAGPASHHVEVAAILARAGVHLLIEKPLSNSLDGIDELLSVAVAGNLVVQVGYCLRFDEALRTMKQALDDGRIGRIIELQAEVGQYLPDWRPDSDYRDTVSARAELGGGALLELSHEIDLARWLAGDIVSVSAVTGRVSDLDIDVEDTADLLVGFKSGAVGNLHLDMVQRVPVRACKVVGSEGTLVWDGIARQTLLYETESAEAETLYAAGEFDSDMMYLEQFRDFIVCVETNAGPRVTGEDGKRVVEIVEAAKRSAKRGRVETL